MRRDAARCLPARADGIPRGSRAPCPVAGHDVRDPAGRRTATAQARAALMALNYDHSCIRSPVPTCASLSTLAMACLGARACAWQADAVDREDVPSYARGAIAAADFLLGQGAHAHRARSLPRAVRDRPRDAVRAAGRTPRCKARRERSGRCGSCGRGPALGTSSSATSARSAETGSFSGLAAYQLVSR